MPRFRAKGDTIGARLGRRLSQSGATVLHAASRTSALVALCGARPRAGHIVLETHRANADCPRCREILDAERIAS